MNIEKLKTKSKDMWNKHKGKVFAFLFVTVGVMGEKTLKQIQKKSYIEGLDTGEYIGYVNGHSDGYSEGHANGYDKGYSDGYDDGNYY